MTLYYKFALIAFSFIFVLQNITAQDISLIHTSFIQAQNDEERYYSLYNVYLTAIEKGVNIDYSGIKDIYLSIPPNATPIPLTSFNDFRGVVFHVYNNSIDKTTGIQYLIQGVADAYRDHLNFGTITFNLKNK